VSKEKKSDSRGLTRIGSIVLVCIISMLILFEAKPVAATMSPETARDRAVDYVMTKYPEAFDTERPAEWAAHVLTPGDTANIDIMYSSDNWIVTVSAPTGNHVDYQVKLEYIGEMPFAWSGWVLYNGQVNEVPQ
jgi:hypothetical protein